MPKNKTRTPGDVTTIELNGAIGWWKNSAEWLRNSVKDKGDILLKANSGGGDVFEANEMFNILRDHPHNVRVEMGALAASAMGYLFLAGDERAVHKNSVWMAHRVSGYAWGDADAMKAEAQMAEGLEGIIATTISDKTGKSKDAILNDMKAVTFLYGGDAIVNYGIATEIIDADEADDAADSSVDEAGSKLKVNAMIDHTRQKMAENPENTLSRIKNFTNFLTNKETPTETPTEEPPKTPSHGVKHMNVELKAAQEEGVAKERTRVNAWHKFNGIDQDYMLNGINSGKELDMGDMAHFNRVALDNNVKTQLTNETIPAVKPDEIEIPAVTNSAEGELNDDAQKWLAKYQKAGK